MHSERSRALGLVDETSPANFFVNEPYIRSRRPEPAEVIRLRVALAERGLRLDELGKRLGLADGTIYRLLADHFASSNRLRWRIEQFFGYAVAIWSSPDILELRKGCAAVTGIDPFLAEKPVLLNLARRFEVRLTNVPRTVSGYRDAIVRHLAVNRSLITTPAP